MGIILPRYREFRCKSQQFFSILPDLLPQLPKLLRFWPLFGTDCRTIVMFAPIYLTQLIYKLVTDKVNFKGNSACPGPYIMVRLALSFLDNGVTMSLSGKLPLDISIRDLVMFI